MILSKDDLLPFDLKYAEKLIASLYFIFFIFPYLLTNAFNLPIEVFVSLSELGYSN